MANWENWKAERRKIIINVIYVHERRDEVCGIYIMHIIQMKAPTKPSRLRSSTLEKKNSKFAEYI